MTSYRSKAAAWGYGDKVLNTHLETIEDNADTALQTLDARVFVGTSYGSYSIWESITNTTAATNIEYNGSAVTISFGTCSTGDVINCNMSFLCTLSGDNSRFDVVAVASGIASVSISDQLGYVPAGTPIYCMTMSANHTITASCAGVVNYCRLLWTPDSSSAYIDMEGKLHCTGHRWRPVV